MITDKIILSVESALNTVLPDEVFVVPEETAYPTSGDNFVRVTGEFTAYDYNDQSIEGHVYITVTCSIRVRDYPLQERDRPYLQLIHRAEQVYFFLITNKTLYEDILAIAPGISYSDRFKSDKLNTRPIIANPDYFGSTDLPARSSFIQAEQSARPAGYYLDQTYRSPRLLIPWKCLTTLAFPDPLVPSP